MLGPLSLTSLKKMQGRYAAAPVTNSQILIEFIYPSS